MPNSNQKEAVVAITTPISVTLFPILLIGPFGTWKTYTLAQAIKKLLLQPETTCTLGSRRVVGRRPNRYYHKRWVATVNSIVQKYCLIDLNINVRIFRRPTVEDILKYRGGNAEHFDGAGLARSAQGTLYDHYPNDFPCKILLCKNYRAREAIIKFTSELFYEQKLIASVKQQRHESCTLTARSLVPREVWLQSQRDVNLERQYAPGLSPCHADQHEFREGIGKQPTAFHCSLCEVSSLNKLAAFPPEEIRNMLCGDLFRRLRSCHAKASGSPLCVRNDSP
ncbi:hypothetical protein pipiens_014005 [Culex pipiens pipiens]|uniref:Uncharacterized protein n=1 Tax=Culex pipiens pipiens TaxID=38569 RepID=A0ABD1CWB3_CULPP